MEKKLLSAMEVIENVWMTFKEMNPSKYKTLFEDNHEKTVFKLLDSISVIKKCESWAPYEAKGNESGYMKRHIEEEVWSLMAMIGHIQFTDQKEYVKFQEFYFPEITQWRGCLYFEAAKDLINCPKHKLATVLVRIIAYLCAIASKYGIDILAEYNLDPQYKTDIELT